MAIVRQTNFAAGELDPTLWGRTDLATFGKGARTMRNFTPTKNGAAMSRPGSLFVREVKTIAQYTNKFGDPRDPPERPVRLERFVFSDRQTFLLEFGELYVRFHTLGRTLLVAGNPYELVTPFHAEQLWDLRFAQVGNVLTIVGQGQPTMELRRNGLTDWSIEETVFTPPDPALPDVGESFFTDPFDPGAAPQVITTTPFMLDTASMAAADGDHPAREWVHAFTAIMKRKSNGEVLESVAQVVKYSTDGVEPPFGTPPVQDLLTTQQLVIYPDKPLRLVRLALNAIPDEDFLALSFRIYRGRGDLLGWIGDTRSREFLDVGEEPDYTTQPPLGFNPFRLDGIAEASWPRPGAVGFFQERRVFAAPGRYAEFESTADRPGTVLFSATGDYYNFDPRLAIHVAGESLTFDLAAHKRELIRHLVGLDRLVVLTDSSAWTIGGQQGKPLDFDSIDARRTDDVGASGVTPVVIDGCVLFVRTKGSGARALIPQAADTPYRGIDLSRQARHLVLGKNRHIVDWAYQEDPFGLLWAVRADGGLLSITFSNEEQVLAWARHDTDGTYESVCTVPESEEDAVYVVVNRQVIDDPDPRGPASHSVRTIERFTSRVRRQLETDPVPTWAEPPTVDDVQTLYPTDVAIDCGITYADVPTLRITGLGRHAFKTVWIIARGSAPATAVVDADGGVDLPYEVVPAPNAVKPDGTPIWLAHVGLGYVCDLESLSIYGDLSQKTIVEVGFELDESRGIKAGQSFAALKAWRQRQVSDAFGVISAATVLLVTPVTNAWDKAARVVLRQELPLPVTVLGITREVERGQ